MRLLRSHTLQGLVVSIFFAFAAVNTNAGEADVVDVTIESLGSGKFRINATLSHDDTGWDHFANRWDVLDESGKIIGVRELLHPHVNEQPFTRSVSITIPETVKRITIRANDYIHHIGGAMFDIDVPHP